MTEIPLSVQEWLDPMRRAACFDDMLAALKGVVSAWEGDSGMGTLYEMKRAMTYVRDAIAKAESR